MMLCIGLGFVITKRGLFPASCAKGVSILSLVRTRRCTRNLSLKSPLTRMHLQNISLPCLIFYSMVDAFSPSNGAAFGSLVLVALIYQFLGFVFAWICRELFYVPADFQWGILVVSFGLFTLTFVTR
jgi:predicted permease